MDQADQLIQELAERQFKFLRTLLSDVEHRLDKYITEYALKVKEYLISVGQIPGNYELFVERRYKEIIALYDEYLLTFQGGIAPTLFPSYNDGRRIIELFLHKSGINYSSGVIDSKTISALVRDASHDFRVAIDSSKDMFKSFYKLSKQGIFTESELSIAAAKGISFRGSPGDVHRAIRDLFLNSDIRKTKFTTLFSAKDRETRQFFIDKFGEKKFLELEKKGSKLLNKQYIRIVNKNGDDMYFTVDRYSEFVARSRITDSQVSGSIEEGGRAGIILYKVPGHQTTADVCKPHEDVIYTTDKELSEAGVFPFLSQQNKPGYHPICSHRIFPYPITKSQLYLITVQKAGSNFANAWFQKRGYVVPVGVAA
ncbi:hypothetical protein [Leptospira interrogans]|uniref:Uncharacterized protein n=1 Tax=Leptospira interrogans serovar Zanoni str. LT2156 TaxID=1001601 RepID=M6HAH0_LEPIR|nr:hypothetical protein [Leptospira interrogans]EMM94313.1 hypothetical protein LEP1GSC158_0610 [Leptospira interrogans serovar Zanoni str. LT2156]ULG86684.1 hypothetical protein FH594_21815 [Leptospira interrogans]ULG86703.1 hypothetical protein FH594_21925 [Leptospira interrogans]ULG86726.1 hypothetical protein FH594_21390 [Leptospira interrogans]